MKKRNYKWICGMLCALLLCAAALMIPTREAKADGESISDPGTKTYGDAPFTLTVTPDASRTVTSYAWTVDGSGVLSIGSGDDTATCTINILSAGPCTVTCTLAYEDNNNGDNTDETAAPTKAITVNKATTPISISGDTEIEAGESTTLTAETSGSGRLAWEVVSNTNNAGITITSPSVNNGWYDAASITIAAGTGQAGEIQVKAKLFSDSSDYDDVEKTATVTASLLPRTLTVTNPGALVSGSGDTTLSVSANPAIESTETVAWHGTVTGTGVSFDTATGKITAATDAKGSVADIYATLPVRGNYAAASSESSKFTVQVNPKTPVVTGLPGSVALAINESATLSTNVRSNNSIGAITYVLSDVSPAGCVRLDDEATGKITAVAAGTAQVKFTQAAGDNVAAADGPTCNVTVGAAPSIVLNPSSVTITTDKGKSPTITAQVLYAGSAVDVISLDVVNKDVAMVQSIQSAKGQHTFKVIARSHGTTKVIAKTRVGTTDYTAELPVTVSLPASYLEMDSWYHYLNRDRKYTEVSAVLHNPGNGIPINARTYWYTDNSVTKILWTNQYMQYDANNNTYYTRIRLQARRNGTTVATMSLDGGTSVHYELHVTNMSYIPQSGQDSTAIYVVSALLLLSAATTAGVYIYRRKRTRF